MRRAKAVATAMHPHVRWLCAHLPEGSGRHGRAFVLASSAEAATALRDSVVAERGGMLGVRFLTPVALARELSWLLGEPAGDDVLPPLAERAILCEVLRGQRGEAAPYALRHRASLGALLATCREWMRGGAPEPGAAAPSLSNWGRETLAIARAFAAALAAHARESRGKRIARLRSLLAAGRRPRQPLFVAKVGDHDARDVLGVLDHLAACSDVQIVTAPAAEVPVAARSRSAHPTLDAELRAAAHRCALAFASGVTLRDMVVAAPRLGPYVPSLTVAFAAEGMPLRAHAETPITREPRGALAAHAVRLLFDGAPARAYLALAGSELAKEPLPPAEQHALEVRARTLGLSGAGALPERVVAALSDRAPAAAERVRRLAGRVRTAQDARTGEEKVDALIHLLDGELNEPATGSRDAEAAATLAELSTELRYAAADDFVGDALDLLQGRGLPVGPSGGEAVHVVEYGDALAFPARHLTLLGAADDQVPLPTPPPTFLSDHDRVALGLSPRATVRADETRRLVQLAALPTSALHVSRSQTDTQGRPVGPSPLLESTLAPVLAGCDETVERAHPQARALARVQSGLAPLDAAVVHVALIGSSAAAASKLLGARGAAATKRVATLERFAGDLAFDGDIGSDDDRERAGAVSVSSLEQLAKCAHQYLFQRVLRVQPLPPEPDALALAPSAVGANVHDLLAQLHARLGRAAQTDEVVDEAALAHELLPRLDAMLADASPLAHTLPGLHRILVRQWTDAVARTFADDVRALRTHGLTPLHQEHPLEGELDLGDGRSLSVRGRADRVDRLADGSLRIIDYKTGARPRQVLSTTEILKGRHLQMPAYAAMATQTLGGHVHDLGVRAVHPGLAGDDEFWLRWRYAQDFLGGKFTDALRETLQVLADVRASGTFVPGMDAARVCRFCEFRAACRRLHPPSRERVYNADRPTVQRYLRLRSKSTYQPVLGGDDGS
ncbi:MAG: PD-(D/E)XK nuclease family protein [Planctomycetota bacterium]